MKIHSLHHAPFEGLGNIEKWISSQGYNLTSTCLWLNETLPEITEFDALIVMGGPMSVHDEQTFPWLIEEKKFIEKAIAARKTVLGICLGAQLIATVLGAKVQPGPFKEIGWFPLKVSATYNGLLNSIPKEFTAFHWHGEAFELPQGCEHLASSKACHNQAFSYADHVLALQFHPEVNANMLEKMLANCTEDLLSNSPYVQSTEELKLGLQLYTETNQQVLNEILKNLFKLQQSRQNN